MFTSYCVVKYFTSQKNNIFFLNGEYFMWLYVYYTGTIKKKRT